MVEKGTQEFDVVIIGSGPGGYVAAIRAAQLGLQVAIIERSELGGICLNWGCIPTKALLRSSEVYHQFSRASEFGLKVENYGFDFDAIIKRSRKVAAQLSSGVAHLMKKNKITVIKGTAKLAGASQISFENDGAVSTISAKNIIIATGARARDLPGLEADQKRVWNYRTALNPPFMPKNLLVIGSGAIGVEFASFYHNLGAKTTIVEVMDRILPVEDAEISQFAKKSFMRQGLTIYESTMVTKLERHEDKVIATIKTQDTEMHQEFDAVISAVGIVGNVENLGLEALQIAQEKSHILVDEYCRTYVKNIFAIGDIAGAPWLAHKASHEGVMVAELIAGKEVHPMRKSQIAGCTYCHPQIASVGMTEAQAKAENRAVRIGRFPFIGNGKSIAMGESEGMVKTIFDEQTGELLGAHMVGAEVTEMIQGFVVAMGLETTEAELMETIFPHPTISESMHESVLQAYGRALHI